MKRPHDDAHGVTAREQAILDRCEQGADDATVAGELGLAPLYIRKIRTMYSGDIAVNLGFDAMVRVGSASLAAAIERVGGRFA